MSAERDEFLADVVVCFVEDFGTNPWRQIISGTYRWDEADPQGTRAKFIEVDDDYEPTDEHVEHEVTLDTVRAGLRVLRDSESVMASNMRANILAADRENDAGMIDAYDADAIVQLGIFGELVYG